MDSFKPPEALSLQGNPSENWRRWIQRFDLYLTASGKIKEDEKVQCAILLHVIGEEALEIYNTFKFATGEDPAKILVLKKKFEDYVNPRKNTVFERYRFWEYKQQEGETIDQFITELKTRAKSCEFGEQHDSMIRDRIVFGVRDTRLKERLLRESSELTLEKAASICRAGEASTTQIKELEDSDKSVPVHWVENKFNSRRPKPPRSKLPFNCSKCGTKYQPRSCPAFGKICLACKGKDHFAKVCPQMKFPVHVVTPSDQGAIGGVEPERQSAHGEQELFIGTVTRASPVEGSAWFTSLRVGGTPIKFKLDTGAEANVLPLSVYSKLRTRPPLSDTSVVLSSYGDFKVKPLGTLNLNCEAVGMNETLSFFVAAVESPPILGLSACQKLNLVRKVESVSQAALTKEEILAKFPDVFTGLGCMEGSYHIELDDTVEPVIHPPRRVPYSLLPKLKEKLHELEEKDVIQKVDRPTPWVNSLVIVEKRDGSLRLCLDPRDLNKAIRREHHRIPTAEDVASRLSGKKVFSIVDEKDGFWQVCLDDESSHLCTFNTPYGRYRFKRMPFGISSAPEVFQKKNEAIFGDIDGVEVIFDDIIVAAQDDQEHDEIMGKLLQRAQEANVKFNSAKLQYKVSEVKYMGNIVSESGLKPDDEKVRAIIQMPPPQNREELRRFLGMVNYFSQFIPNQSEITAPLRSLLKKDAAWIWSHEHTLAVAHLKDVLSSQPVLKFFDPLKPVKLQVDASKSGLGACILQDGHPIAYASRSLTQAEGHYAQIEKELLAVVFGCERFNQYVYGRPVDVMSDHKPLVSITKKPLVSSSPRLQRLLLRLQKYEVNVTYVPGKYMYVADTLSRAYLDEQPIDTDLNDDAEVMVHSLITNLPMSKEKLAQMKSATAQDEDLQMLSKVVKNGWPFHRNQLPAAAAHYWNLRGEIHEAEGLLFLGQRLIIPQAMRQEVLNCIHESHLGIEKCKSRARAVVYWPGMSTAIERMIAKCPVCLKHQRQNQKEPLLPHEVPHRPWQKLGADIFELNSNSYLVVVDYYSKYPELCLLKDKTASSVITSMKSMYARHGIPDKVVADNMPFSSKAFQKFASEWGFEVSTSSPRYPQSNGMSERAIQTIKNLLRKACEDGNDPYLALLEYRNTPISGLKESPAQLLMSRMLKSKLPTVESLLKPQVVENPQQKLQQRSDKQKMYYDRNAKPLPVIKEGETARIRKGKTWEPAIVTAQHTAPRSFMVTTPDGTAYRRNRRHLLPTEESPPVIAGPAIDLPGTPSTVAEPLASVTPPDGDISSLDSSNQHSPQQTPPKCTSSGRTVRLPARFREDYVMN